MLRKKDIHRSLLNFVENTVVHERNLLEKWGPSTWSDGIVEKWSTG